MNTINCKQSLCLLSASQHFHPSHWFSDYPCFVNLLSKSSYSDLAPAKRKRLRYWDLDVEKNQRTPWGASYFDLTQGCLGRTLWPFLRLLYTGHSLIWLSKIIGTSYFFILAILIDLLLDLWGKPSSSNESLHWKFASAWSSWECGWLLFFYLYLTGRGTPVKLENIDKSIQKTGYLLQGISPEVSLGETDSLHWSKWCWKINSPLHYEQTNQEGSGILSIKGRNWKLNSARTGQRADYPKAED